MNACRSGASGLPDARDYPAEINRRFGGGEAVYKETRISSKAPKIWVVDRNTLTVTGTIPLPAGEGHQIAVIS